MEIFNNIARLSFINILIYCVFIKLINYKNNTITKTGVITVMSVVETLITMVIIKYIGILPTMLLQFTLHGLAIGKITNNEEYFSILVTFLSLTLTYLVYIISILIVGIFMKIINLNLDRNNIIILFMVVIVEVFILYRFFNIKRFKNGFSFLQNKHKIDSIGFIGLLLCGPTILIYSLFGSEKEFKVNESLIIGIIILSICMAIWISRKLTAYYKKKLKEQTIELLEGEIKEKDAEISRIIEENNAIATINHKYSSRIKSLEKISAKISTNPAIMEMMKTEFGEEFGDFEMQIKSLSEDFASEMDEKVKHNSNLPKTGVFGIDNLLDYMSSEAGKSNITFDLKVIGNINYMVDNIINQSRLETLLGDHIKDAIIAIEHSDNTNRRIFTIIGIVDDCYEVCIYDTGIEFEIDILVNLGTKAITTHKDTGGSGIGFMTTFETLMDTKASLIIEEKHGVSNTDFTKAVRIRFDGKEEYVIRSYRADQIRNQNDSKKIIIKDI